MAYQHGHPLPGPQADPDGWNTLRPVISRSHGLKAEVQCLVSLLELDSLVDCVLNICIPVIQLSLAKPVSPNPLFCKYFSC